MLSNIWNHSKWSCIVKKAGNMLGFVLVGSEQVKSSSGKQMYDLNKVYLDFCGQLVIFCLDG